MSSYGQPPMPLSYLQRPPLESQGTHVSSLAQAGAAILGQHFPRARQTSHTVSDFDAEDEASENERHLGHF